MKKMKMVILAVLAVASIGLLTGCGGADTDETGSDTDPGTNNEESTGIIEEIVTDAATGIEDAVTDAADGMEDLGNDIKDDNADQTNGATESTGENNTTGATDTINP